MARTSDGAAPVRPEEAFRRVLRHLRKELGLTQEGLAFGAGLDRTAIGLIERGERIPSLSTLYKLARPLGTTPSVMLARAEELLGRGRLAKSKDKKRWTD